MDENANTAAIVATDGINDSLSSHHNDSDDEDRHGPRHRKSRPSSSRMPDDPTPPLFDDSGLIPQIDRAMSIPYLCCKMWRWRDLQVRSFKLAMPPINYDYKPYSAYLDNHQQLTHFIVVNFYFLGGCSIT